MATLVSSPGFAPAALIPPERPSRLKSELETATGVEALLRKLGEKLEPLVGNKSFNSSDLDLVGALCGTISHHARHLRQLRRSGAELDSFASHGVGAFVRIRQIANSARESICQNRIRAGLNESVKAIKGGLEGAEVLARGTSQLTQLGRSGETRFDVLRHGCLLGYLERAIGAPHQSPFFAHAVEKLLERPSTRAPGPLAPDRAGTEADNYGVALMARED